MKRNSITAIIGKAILLDCDAVLYGIKYRSTYSISANRIIKAAVNEIIRLQAKEEYADQVERLQQRCEEIDMMTQIVNDQDGMSAAGLGAEALTTSPDYMQQIVNVLADIPGSGYENLKNTKP